MIEVNRHSFPSEKGAPYRDRVINFDPFDTNSKPVAQKLKAENDPPPQKKH